MFHPVDSSPRFPAIETEIIRFWNERRIYEKSLERRADAPEFIFYEGPPTANGMPHPGHCLTRAIKDIFPRYRTMRGYRCERKAGWDTHGLPVEVEVCKELGIHSKEEIEAYGIEPFIRKCQASVWRYMQEWERLTERIGFWIKLDEAYVTYHRSYVESVWWSLKNLFDRGLLYQGHKIVWWWAQGGTALSSGEVGQGYREVADPSVYVRFPLVDEPGTSLLVWTTTPWTLPSNQFAAVHPDLEYAVVADGEDTQGGKLIVAAALVETIAGKIGRELKIEKKFRGDELLGRRYHPPFDYYYRSLGEVEGELAAGDTQHVAWRVVSADFVTVDSGTGVVHQAPAFGEVDFEVLARETRRFKPGQGPELICAVGPDGKFTAEAPDYQGRWVKEADKDISRELRRRGLLYHQEQYLHEYPFCWRADEDPLIQYPRRSWFIRTSRFKEEMLANNRRINWLPEHIRDGRFGNFLETNVDWALSRERYWGTPLPIWVCEETGYMEAVGSYDELIAKPGVQGVEVWEAAKHATPELPDDLKVHKPYIDAVTYSSPRAPGKRMRRVTEVIDCWYDSGAMPFAQWGYPHQGRERFTGQFPADFISEALDQTRGWFYSQLAISTLLFGAKDNPDTAAPPHEYPHPFRNCIVLGLMLGEDGQKMSKSKRNYREPNEIFDRYGADALRWYFFANQPPWTSIRYNEQSIKDSIPEFLLRLWNVYSFFVIYANIDKFNPGQSLAGEVSQLDAAVLAKGRGYRPVSQRSELDRWVLSELSATAQAVTERMDAYDNFAACGRITAFVDALSNWYVRRSRDRFWSGEESADKLDAYWTLYECLLTTAKLVAPFVPFLAETLWQNLAVAATEGRALESVHLCDYPTGEGAVVDRPLSEQMDLVREIVSLGRSARMGAKLKVRQPLAKVEIVLVHPRHQAWLETHTGLIREELNVKQVEFIPRADQYITYTVLPDLKRLGPRLGKRLPALKQALATADAAALLARLDAEGKVTLELADGPVELDATDIQVRLQAKPGWAAAQGSRAVVVVSTELTDELIVEGIARELVHSIQTMRKEKGCDFTDRIALAIVSDSPDILRAIDDFEDYIRSETLAIRIRRSALSEVQPSVVDIASHEAAIYLAIDNTSTAQRKKHGAPIAAGVPATEIAPLLADIESFRVERTESLIDTDKICKAICAFANDMPGSGLPGFVFLGVDKQGKPIGAKIDERALERLAAHRDNGNILPIPSMQVYKASHAGTDVAVIQVDPSDMPPVRYKQTVWIRTGPSADRATAEQERRLEERRIDRAKTWDLRACREASLDDLALDLFTLNYLPRGISQQVLDENERTVQEQLGSLRLWHKKQQVPTNGAVLLFAKDPVSFFPGAYVQYVRYDGVSQADTPIREQRIAGDFLNVLRDLDRLAKSIANSRPVRDESLAEHLVFDYPTIALHELLMNAIIHRNYDGSTTPVSVNHFSDRIEIQNPGSLYGDLAKEHFPGGTAYRNPVLAEAAKVLGFANQFGRGLPLATKELELNGSPRAEYVPGENHFAVIVRKRP